MSSLPRPRSLVALIALVAAALALVARAAEPARTISLVTDPAPGPAAQHGLAQLAGALRARGWTVDLASTPAAAKSPRHILARSQPPTSDLTVPESLAISHPSNRTAGNTPVLSLRGADDRGLMYALLDVADRVSWAKSDDDPFSEVHDITEQPAVRERSLSVYTMNRAYWESRFYDEAYWTRYFDLLAASRFNKFLIVFGYENGGFLAPCYPYFFDTPGFPGVHMHDLTPAQQQKNLAALRRLIDLAHARGLAVSIGIWDHIYRAGVQSGGIEWAAEYKDRPVPGTVTGVTTENLNAYTLASLEAFLRAFPALDEVQFRIHEESGLKREEMDAFWREVFTMTKRVKPAMRFEARAKGTPDSVIRTALDLGVNLRVETKYWMEQMGLPFHPTHVNPPDQKNRRHGYADLLKYPKRYDINWRLWNGGTARVLLWADPEYVRRYSASTALYASPNWDVNEPLATKMEAQRPEMAPFDLMPAKYRYYDYEFERYWHFYQVWGRVGYNPATPPEIWGHAFERRFGPAAAPHIEAALHRASEVLPMIVAAVYPYSAFPTTRGWAERQSLGPSLAAYAKNTGTDVQQFESFEEAARRILAGGTTPRRTPDATSRWFDATADAVLAEVRAAEAAIGAKRGNEFDSTITDLKILAQLARFHARRVTAAVHYNLFLRGQQLGELYAATMDAKASVEAWRGLVAAAGDRYAPDLAMGARNFSLCGHWRDELVRLEHDFKDLEAQCCPPDESTLQAKVWTPLLASSGTSSTPALESPHVEVSPGPRPKPGAPYRVVARVTAPGGVASVTLRYRHVTQYEDYATLEMKPTGTPSEYAATVPGDFLVPEWDLMYLVEIIARDGHGAMWPDLAREQPYVIVPLAR